ncbi:transposase [Gordonia hydrophobica]|nr:transposase [Gordonia hydrophobica]
MISVEDWAEIRRLHRAEGLPIKAIVRRTGVARNTVRAALRSEEPPAYRRASKGSLVDAVEPQIRQQLTLDAQMPATVIAERIGWTNSLTILKDRIRQIRPEYVGIDPADRIVRAPGESAQMDLWFPATRIPTGHGQTAILPVLVMTLTFSKLLSAMMIPSRQAGDILAGMWELIAGVGKVSKTLVWDRESAIGGRGKLTDPAAMFAGTLGTRIVLAPPRDRRVQGHDRTQ